jgi:hypothetical protein
MHNRYLIDQDPERVAARRLEIKRALAQRELNRQRITELNEIVRKLDADSDDAAEQHGIAAGKLQEELDRLDSEHVDGILSGKTASQKSIQRRTQILGELAELNTALETRCEANRRSKQPFLKQVEQLRSEIAGASSLESELLQLCGSKWRVAQVIDELSIQGARSLLNEALRRQAIHQKNLVVNSDWDDLNKRSASERTQIDRVKLDDATKVVEHFQQVLDEALRASEQQRKLAITE